MNKRDLKNCVAQYLCLIFDLFEAQGGLEGLKLDEIEAANSFLMLPMARTGSKWPIWILFKHIFLYFPIFFQILQYSYECHYCYYYYIVILVMRPPSKKPPTTVQWDLRL